MLLKFRKNFIYKWNRFEIISVILSNPHRKSLFKKPVWQNQLELSETMFWNEVFLSWISSSTDNETQPNNYKISLEECDNNHKTSNIFFEDFECKVELDYGFYDINNSTISKGVKSILDSGYQLEDTLPAKYISRPNLKNK